MAQTTPLAAGTTAANSTDIAVSTTPVTLSLFSGESDQSFERCKLSIYQKDSNGNYHPYVTQRGERRERVPIYLTNVEPTVILNAPGTFRVVRSLQNKQVGVNADA